MSGLQIMLLVIGAAVFVASFVIPDMLAEEDKDGIDIEEKREEIRAIIDSEMKEAQGKLQDVVDETVNYAVEKSERSLEKLSNEKITAVSEFSETVLTDIHKSHQDAMFLYDMLHDKQKNLHETVMEADKSNAKVLETKNELEYAAKQIEESVAQAGVIPPAPVATVSPAPAATVAAASLVAAAPANPAAAPVASANAAPAAAARPASAGAVSPAPATPTPAFAKPAVNGGASADASVDGEDLLSQVESVIAAGEKNTMDPAANFDAESFVEKAKAAGEKPGGRVLEMPVINNVSDGDVNSNNNERILEMHKQGRSNMAIAKELGLGVGEVNLVIDLFEVM